MWSEELYRIMGYDLELPPPSFSEMSSCYTPDSWNRLSDAVNEALNSGAYYELDLEIVRPDGVKRHTSVRGEADYDINCNIVKLYGTVQDITERKEVEASLRETLQRLRTVTGSVIDVIVMAVESRDPYTSGHQKRVSDLAQAIASEMGLPMQQAEGIRLAGLVHDLGKISIPTEILSTPRKMSELEYSLVQTHSQNGYDILKEVDFDWPVAQMVYQHHERLDGSGYPRGLKGDDIILEAKIIAVADVVEAIASHRPYRPALGINTALEEIEHQQGVLYDPIVVGACLQLFRKQGYQLCEA